MKISPAKKNQKTSEIPGFFHLKPLLDTARILIRNRILLWEMTRRDVLDRYTGQMLGAIWAFVHPLAMMAVFLFIFGVVFKMKVQVADMPDVQYNFAIYMISGLLPWMVASDAMSRSCLAIRAQAALVKQVVFPLEILPAKVAIAVFLPIVVGHIILAAYTLLAFGSLPITYLLLPLLYALLFLMMAGISAIFASGGVFVRDIKDVVQLIVLLGIYFAPVFFTLESLPRVWRILIYINPFAHAVLCFQDATFYGHFAHPASWVAFPILSLVSAILGASVFQKLKTFFGTYL